MNSSSVGVELVIRATEKYGRLMRARRTLLILLLPALLLVASATAAQLRTTATEHPFRIDVNPKLYAPNCGPDEWSTPRAYCESSTAPSGHLYEFPPGNVAVSWCTAGTSSCDLGKGYQLPSHNYTRWLKFCMWRGYHECPTSGTDWLLGAVVMPNGPFAVVAGNFGNHGKWNSIHPTSHDQTKIAHRGGPLHLVVTYTGKVSRGDGVRPSNGYTFVLSGYLFF
jgi:hypothetical protein